MSVVSLQAIVNGKHALRPVLHRDVTSTPADTGPINWRPLSISTASVSSNDPQAAYERVTEQFAKPPPIIPRITIMNCDNEIPDIVADMPEESACSDTDVSRSSCNSDRSNDRPASTTSQLDRLHPRHSSASTNEQVNVPYRPWYCTSESPSSVANKLHDVNSQDNNLALHDWTASKAELSWQTTHHWRPPRTSSLQSYLLLYAAMASDTSLAQSCRNRQRNLVYYHSCLHAHLHGHRQH
jgi:hypothetical protein